WQSNGTEAGTFMVKDINTTSPYGFPVGSYPHYLTDVGGTLFFAANDGTHSLELWKSNGTEATTVLVKDINPGGGNNGSLPNELTAVNGTLYFTAFVPNTGIELWKSRGTGASTVLVKAINPGPPFSSPHNLAFVNGALFFSADDGQNGREPWILTPDPPAARGVLAAQAAPEEGSSQQIASGVSKPDQPSRTLASAPIRAGDSVLTEPDLETEWLDEFAVATYLDAKRDKPDRVS